MSTRFLAACMLSLVLAACASQPVSTASSSSAAVPAPASTASTPLAVAVENPRNFAADGLAATAWMQTSVEYEAIVVQTYRDAQDQLLTALKTPGWDALEPDERHNVPDGLKLAVIVDVDETVLDNSPYQARLIRSGTVYDDATWADWVREARAKALPGAVAFAQFAADHGVTVLYISNRDHSLDTATLQNLREQGFPVAGPQAFLGLGAVVPGCQQKGSDKTCRRQLIARDYRVLLQVGDQIGDFMSVPDNSLSARKQAAKAHMAWFGERWFMLPNPTYGSWQPALFDNDWSRSPAQRHADTIKALRVQ